MLAFLQPHCVANLKCTLLKSCFIKALSTYLGTGLISNDLFF